MSSQPENLDDQLLLRKFRFSLRKLLIWMSVAAVTAFLVAPLIRFLTVDQRWRLGKTLGVAVLGSGLVFALTILLRMRVDARCGQPLIKVQQLAAARLRLLSLVSMIVHLILIALLCYVATRVPEKSSDLWIRYLVPFQFSVAATYYWAMSYGANRQNTLFCQNGIRWNSIRFAPWSKVRFRGWNEVTRQLNVSFNSHWITVTVPPGQWPTIRELLLEHSDFETTEKTETVNVR